MITIRGLTGGVLIGWLSILLSIAVGLVMSPFLIHHLGETGYGVWVLVQSTVSYMYLMDLGLRTTVVRFSAQA
jgi:O-antigen/teichoic acid export membrane protein